VLWLCIIPHFASSAFCGSPQNAEFEREILRERVKAGIAQARAKGTTFGRPKSVKNPMVALQASVENIGNKTKAVPPQ